MLVILRILMIDATIRNELGQPKSRFTAYLFLASFNSKL